MSVSKVTLTTEASVWDVTFVGGGVVTLTERASALAKKEIRKCELTPLPEFAKGRGTLVASVMSVLAKGDEFDVLGTVTW